MESSDVSPALNEGLERRRMLVLAWNHLVPALVAECASYEAEALEIDIVTLVPTDEREAIFARYELDLKHVALFQMHADYTAPKDLKRLEPETYDHIIMMGSDWLATGEESDARTIVGYLLLQQVLAGKDRPQILVELLDPENVSLLGKRPGEALISPVILSHMLAQVGLRRELAPVFDELFTAGGSEIAFRSASRHALVGRSERRRQGARSAQCLRWPPPIVLPGLASSVLAADELQSGLATATGQGAVRAVYSATLPSNQRLSLERP